MIRNTVHGAVAAGTLLVSLVTGTIPAFGYKMIQSTTVGYSTVFPNGVSCNDPGGFAHWTTSNIYWYRNPSGQGLGKETVLENAMAAWTNVTSAAHRVTLAGTTNAGLAVDGQNTIVWADGNGCTGGCHALTALMLQDGQVIVESDITFNADPDTPPDIQAVATHELGHALGIHHPDWEETIPPTPRPTMIGGVILGIEERTLEADDISALQCAQSRYPPDSGNCPAPSATINAPGGLTASKMGIATVDATPGATYQWTVENGMLWAGETLTEMRYIAGCSGTTTVRVTVTASCGQQSQGSATSTIWPPKLQIWGGGTIAPGETATVYAGFSGAYPWQLTWSDGFKATSIITSTYPHDVSPATTTRYTATFTDKYGCTGPVVESFGPVIVTVE